ncbi:ICOS ligand-like [Narcine bancroftii]|uniref:ICOS ligand-like n=1 Tax=Narcine bancroftii TaxID=1343680 RepID=UPI00383126B5
MKNWWMGIFLLVTCGVAGDCTMQQMDRGRQARWAHHTTVVLGLLGQEIILPCVDAKAGRTDWRFLLVSWQRGKEVVHAQDGWGSQKEGQHKRYTNRTTMDEQAFGRGDYSLRLTGLRRADEGDYKCILLQDVKLQESTVTLVTAANFSRPVIEGPDSELTEEGQTVNLTCLSWGGYPKPRVSWMDGDERPLTNATQDNQTSADPVSGLWNISSWIQVKPTPNSSYTCTVLNTRTGERRSSVPWHGIWEDDAKLGRRNKTFSLVMAAVMVCGILVALGLVLLNLRKGSHHPEMHTGRYEEHQTIALNSQLPC